MEDEGSFSDDRSCGRNGDDTKRANHNALERKRRVFQKERLQELRVCVPTIRTDKPSTVEILQKSTEYIEYMKKRHSQQENEISQLRRQNMELTQRLISSGAVKPQEVEKLTKSIEEHAAYLASISGRASSSSSAAEIRPRRPNSESHVTIAHGGMNGVPIFPRPGSAQQRSVSVSGTGPGMVIGNGSQSMSDSRSMSLSMDIAEEVTLFTDFCDTVRRNSMSVDGAHSFLPQPMSGVRHEDGGSDVDIDDDIDVDGASEDAKPTALCRCGKPWGGRYMVMCEKCKTWYHGDCVGVKPRRGASSFRCDGCCKAV